MDEELVRRLLAGAGFETESPLELRALGSDEAHPGRDGRWVQLVRLAAADVEGEGAGRAAGGRPLTTDGLLVVLRVVCSVSCIVPRQWHVWCDQRVRPLATGCQERAVSNEAAGSDELCMPLRMRALVTSDELCMPLRISLVASGALTHPLARVTVAVSVNKRQL
jgi:hypothetical protein